MTAIPTGLTTAINNVVRCIGRADAAFAPPRDEQAILEAVIALANVCDTLAVEATEVHVDILRKRALRRAKAHHHVIQSESAAEGLREDGVQDLPRGPQGAALDQAQ